MKQRTLMFYGLAVLTGFLMTSDAIGQTRKSAAHRRGMLHETIYNTGEIGRSYDQGNLGIDQGYPSFEWPGRSEIVVDGVPYRGQNNSFGGGMYLAANSSDSIGRVYAFCGAVGASSPEAVLGRYSFPLALTRTENFPLLSDGTPNPSYNPNEAEEIIVSKWATPTGLTVTRTSRAWSLPDYDDFIIYEYEIENTGDRNGDPATVEHGGTLTDVLVSFAWGLTPSQIGYERTFNRWSYDDYEKKDLRVRFDRNRWLNYVLDRNAKPEPTYFNEWSATNTYGGGLLSPQAVGYVTLYYDTLLLAKPNETVMQITQSDSLIVWDANGHLKQPYMNRLETSNMRSTKILPYLDVALTRKNPPYRNMGVFGPDWVGRGSFNVRQTKKNGVGSIMTFGPYTIPFGQKVRFSIAQVAGYGAARLEQTQAGLFDEGGSCGEMCGEPSDAPFYPVPNLTQTITYGLDNMTYGSNYLSTYPLPQYVNSNTVTMREVADRAIEAYTGQPYISHDTVQYWPERSPAQGMYQLPLVVLAPVVTVRSDVLAHNLVEWASTPETFSSPRLAAAFSHYEVFKSIHPLGPWMRLDSVGANDPRFFAAGKYSIKDSTTRVGESFFYSVVSVDVAGNRSSRSTGNLKLHNTVLGGTDRLEKVVVVPNPFFVNSGFGGQVSSNDPSGTIGFYNLPRICTIRIFSYSGQLVETIEHDSGNYSEEYLQVTRNNQLMASGLYFFVVDTPTGERTHGKFVIIR